MDLREQIAKALECTAPPDLYMPPEVVEFLSQKFTVRITRYGGVVCTGDEIWKPFGDSFQNLTLMELGGLVNGMTVPYAEAGSRALRDFESNLDLSRDYVRAFWERQVARTGSALLQIELMPGRSWPLTDVLVFLCNWRERIPDLPEPFRRQADRYRGRGDVMNQIDGVTGWQVLVWVILPMIRVLYNIPPPQQPFGKGIRIARNVAALNAQTEFELEEFLKKGEWPPKLSDFDPPAEGIAIEDTRQPMDQEVKVDVPDQTAKPLPTFNENPHVMSYMNPIPNVQRLNVEPSMSRLPNPPFYRQDQADIPRRGYLGRIEHFGADGRPRSDQDEEPVVGLDEDEPPSKERRLESRRYAKRRSAGRRHHR